MSIFFPECPNQHWFRMAGSKYSANVSLFVMKHWGYILQLEQSRKIIATKTDIRRILLETIKIC